MSMNRTKKAVFAPTSHTTRRHLFAETLGTIQLFRHRPILTVIIAILAIRSASAMTPLKINVDKISDDCYITHWYLIGPFGTVSSNSSNTEPISHHDFLSDLGVPEQRLNTRTIAKLSKGQILKLYQPHSALVSLEGTYPSTDNSEVYAVAELRSRKSGEVGIEVGSVDPMTLSVNGQRVLVSGGTASHIATAYADYGVAQLHRGSNILIARIDRKQDGGNFLLSITGAAYMRSVIRIRSSNNIVRPIFVNSQDPIVLSLPLACAQPNNIVDIWDSRGNLQYFTTSSQEQLTTIRLPAGAEGYYSLKASTLCGPIDDSFYIGDPSIVYNNLVAIRDTKMPTSREYLTLDAIIQRYEVLTAPAYSRPFDRSWQMKLRMIIKDGVNATISPNSLQWSREPGLHLREYISAIDGGREPYLICIPTSNANSYPLVVTLPPVLGTGRPFLESAFLSSMNDLDRLTQASNESHAIVLRYGNRGNLRDAPMADAQMLEVLSDIEREFNIDTKRIYLLGYSEAGRRSLLLAERYPSLFAAVLTYGGLTEAYEGDESHAEWSRANNVAAMLDNLGNVPTIIVNGDRDTENSVDDARSMYQTMIAHAVPASFHVFHYGLHVQPGSESVLLPYLMDGPKIASYHINYSMPSVNSSSSNDWIQIMGRDDRRLMMKVVADIQGSEINIRSSNVNSVCIDFSRLKYPVGQKLIADWNDRKFAINAESGCVPLQRPSPYGPRSISAISDGSVAEALAEPFMVVMGTGSNVGDNPAARAFISKWKEEFFVAPRLRIDTDITDDDIRQFNLVLVGKAAESSRLSVANRLAERVMSESLFLTQQFDADPQGIFVLPNPLNVKRSLVYMGMDADIVGSLGFDPAFTGFYEYKFWNRAGVTLKAGLFSESEVNELSVKAQDEPPLASGLGF